METFKKEMDLLQETSATFQEDDNMQAVKAWKEKAPKCLLNNSEFWNYALWEAGEELYLTRWTATCDNYITSKEDEK